MIKKFKHQGVTWLDVISPTHDEIERLAKDYDLHPLIASELLEPSMRSKVDVYEKFIFLILHFPVCEMCYGSDPNHPDAKDAQEIDFIIGKHFLITVRYQAIPPLEEFAHIIDTASSFQTKHRAAHAGHLLFTILRRLYQSLEEGLHFINQNLKLAEANIFGGREKDMVKALSDINRSLLDFRWSLKNHSGILDSFETAGREFFGPAFSYYLRAITGEYTKIWNMLESSRETFTDLRQTNESLLSIKTNEVMKILTIMAFVTFPLSVFTSLFGMNTINNPILGHPYDFWIIVVIMLGAVTAMFAWFRYKRWF